MKNVKTALISSFLHFKGGVGKTTLCVNCGAFLGKLGYKVLIIDLDKQRNASEHVYSIEQDIDDVNLTIFNILKNYRNFDISTAITSNTNFENVDLIVGSKEIDLVEMEIRNKSPIPNIILHSALEHIKNKYDFILIDCPPRVETLTYNAMMASDNTITPLHGEYSFQGLSDIRLAIKDLHISNPKLSMLAPIINQFNARNQVDKYHLESLTNIVNEANDIIHKDIITVPVSTIFSQCAVLKESIITNASKSSKPYKAIEKICKLLILEKNNKNGGAQ